MQMVIIPIFAKQKKQFMGKILTAKEILEKNGYVENKFDTNGFLELVGKWFSENKIEDKLLIISKRFIEMSNPPSCGYIDMTDTDKWVAELSWEQVVYMTQRGLINPIIYVDEPYIKNAVFALRTLAGYVVSRLRKETYIVKLI